MLETGSLVTLGVTAQSEHAAAVLAGVLALLQMHQADVKAHVALGRTHLLTVDAHPLRVADVVVGVLATRIPGRVTRLSNRNVSD